LLRLFERADAGRLELDIAPSFAAVQFPVVALEWSKERGELPGVPLEDPVRFGGEVESPDIGATDRDVL
jgi:hypothetical protein